MEEKKPTFKKVSPVVRRESESFRPRAERRPIQTTLPAPEFKSNEGVSKEFQVRKFSPSEIKKIEKLIREGATKSQLQNLISHIKA